MEILKNEYNRLSQMEMKFSLIDDVKKLREEALKKQSLEYYYLCNILISDIHLEHNNYEEAIKILRKDIHDIDKALFKNLYISILDRVLYIYISRKNFRLAYHYAKEKIKYIDKNDIHSKNRWNLEMSYIYAEMNEIDKASNCLLEILDNPSDEILPYVLSNLTKLYLDQSKVTLAESTLNECLKYTNDEEGLVYCDYLLARLCILKEQKSEALALFKNIFDNEDINQMTLPIVNEYLSLLYDLKMYDQMGLIISKISLFINASDDYYIQKEFITYKIKYLSAIKSLSSINELLDEYQAIDRKINDFEKKIMFEIMEVETNDKIVEEVNDVVKKMDKLTNVISNNVIGSSLRDLIMNYNKSLENVMSFDESTFVLFNRTCNIDYLLNDDIICMHYKNGRLYEKKLSYEALSKSLAAILLEKNQEISFNFDKINLEINNIFNNKSYKSEEIKYVNAIPCRYQDDIFACMIYASRNDDITNQSDLVLFRTSTKILEASLTSVFLSENLDITKHNLDNLVLNNNIGMLYVSNDIMYLSNTLMNYLRLNHKSIKRDDFIKMINKSDTLRYQNEADVSKPYSIEYKINLNDKVISVVEEMDPYYDNNNSLLYSVGTIELKEEDKKALIDGKDELIDKINYLKMQAKKVEFRFSIIRFRCSISNFSQIRNIFGVDPYYVNDSDFVIVLENEINIKTIEHLALKLNCKYSVLRYPRDIVNIDEAFNLSKLCLDNSYTVFNSEVYKEFLRKRSFSKIISNALKEKLPLSLNSYISYDASPFYEAKFSFNGLSSFENARNFIENDLRNEYDLKLIRTLIDKSINDKCMINISNRVIKKMLDTNSLPRDNHNNIVFLLSENDNLLKEVIERLALNNFKVIIDSSLMEFINIIYFDLKYISGIYISKRSDEKTRDSILRISHLFNLDIISTFRIDYRKNTYLSNETHEVN